MSNLLTILIPDVMYDERIRDTQMLGDKDSFNTTVKMQVRLAVKNAGDKNWKEYGRKDVLKRTISCRIDKTKVICNELFNYKILLYYFCYIIFFYLLKKKHGYKYDCDLIQLFELQSLHYDFYLINLRFLPNGII